jgi:hypothetical protein
MSDPSHQSNGRFAPGNPGGPGRPRSAVSAAALALDQAAAGVHQELMQVVLEQARAGNLEATKMLWSRIWPVRRGRPIAVEVPAIDSAKDVLSAKAAITDAVLAGDITANEARPILKVIDSQRDQIGDQAWCKLAGEVARIMTEDE